MKKNLLKSFLFACFAACTMNATAESLSLTPSEATYIQAGNKDTNYSEAGVYYANFSKVSGGVLTDQLSAWGGSDITIIKFDASALPEGCTITEATLSFFSQCTVSGKNSQLAIVPIGTDWTAATATWNSISLAADGSQVTSLAYSNSSGETTQTYDAKNVLTNDEDKVLAFAIFTNTGRQQEVYSFNLAIEYSAEAIPEHSYTVNAVVGETIIKALTEGTIFEGQTYSVSSLSYIITSDGVNYKLDDSEVSGYSKSFTMGQADEVNVVNYVEDATTTYFFEAESILSRSYGNANGAYSNGVAAGVYSGATLTMSGIAPAIYCLTVNTSVRRANDDVFTIQTSADGTTWEDAGTLTLTSNEGGEFFADDVTLMTKGYIRLLEANNSNTCHYIDYITLEKTGESLSEEVLTAISELESSIKEANELLKTLEDAEDIAYVKEAIDVAQGVYDNSYDADALNAAKDALDDVIKEYSPAELVNTLVGTYTDWDPSNPTNFIDESKNVVAGFKNEVEVYSNGTYVIKNWLNNEGLDLALTFDKKGNVETINNYTGEYIWAYYHDTDYAYIYTGTYSYKYTNPDGDEAIYLTLYVNGAYTYYNLVLTEKPTPYVYEGKIYQDMTSSQGSMGTSTSDQTVTITPVSEGVVNITYSGFTFPGLPFTVPEFTIENVTVTEQPDGSALYSADGFQIGIPMGMMTVNYNGTLTGTQTDAASIPTLMLNLQNATLDTTIFGDESVVEQLATSISSVATSTSNATVKKVVDGKIIIVKNGASYNVNGTLAK